MEDAVVWGMIGAHRCAGDAASVTTWRQGSRERRADELSERGSRNFW